MKTLLISSLLSATLVCCFFSLHDATYMGGLIVVFFVGWTLTLCFPVAFVLWLIRKGL
jgi:hypothetical protein